jgi:hypothetical protein
MSPPILKLRAFFSKRGLLEPAAPALAPDEATTFFLVVVFFTYKQSGQTSGFEKGKITETATKQKEMMNVSVLLP